jgi:cytochrome d ubiquinol oxidase subunit I
VTDLAITLAASCCSPCFIFEMGLMLKYIRKGPHTDVPETDQWQKLHHERLSAPSPFAQPAE